MQDILEAKIDVNIPGLDADHSATELATEELLDDIYRTADLAVADATGQPNVGTKGWEDVLTVVLTSPIAVYSFVKLVRLWLERDRDRRITVTVEQAGTEPTRLSVDGQMISIELLERALLAALPKTNAK